MIVASRDKCFPKGHYPVDPYNVDCMCLLCYTNRIICKLFQRIQAPAFTKNYLLNFGQKAALTTSSKFRLIAAVQTQNLVQLLIF